MSRVVSVLWIASSLMLVLSGCKSGSEQTREEDVVSQTAAPESQPSKAQPDEAAESQPAATDSTAPALAREIWSAAGGESWDSVERVAFDFVVEAGGERAFVAKHDWDRSKNTDRVVWTGKDGKERVITVSLEDKSATGTVGGEDIGADAARAKALGEEAYARWVNDSYWLLKQIKVLDDGVTTKDAGEREIDGKSYRVLELSFEGVGLTPGDRYWFFFDEASKKVIGWEMKLQGSEGDPVMVSWEAHQAFGPLELATSHTLAGGGRRILLEEVEIEVN